MVLNSNVLNLKNTIYSDEKTNNVNTLEKCKDKSLRDLFLIKLLKGQINDSDIINDAMAYFDITFSSNYFTVMIFTIDEFDKILNIALNGGDKGFFDQIPALIREIIEFNINEIHKGYTVQIDEKIVCLVNITVNEDYSGEYSLIDEMRNIAEKIKKYVGNSLDIALSIAASDIYSSLSDIANAYSDALTVLSFILHEGKTNAIVFNYSTTTDTVKQGFEYFFYLKNSLLNYLQEKDFDLARKILVQILNRRMPNDYVIFNIHKTRIIELVNSMLHAVAMIRTKEDERFYEELNPFVLLLDSYSYEQLKDRVLMVFDRLEGFYSLKYNEQAYQKTMEVIRYINTNYTNPDISIKLISARFNTSISYLSRIFKRYAGMGMLDYIHKLRIDFSKILLMERNENIEAIARKTGFLNTLTFSRLFKKFEGTTPGKFRDKYINK